MKLIDVEGLKDDMAVLLERNEKLIDPWLIYAIDDTIDEQTVIDAEPVRRGRWIEDEVDKYICSECGAGNHYAYSWSVEKGKALQDLYCPKCGAKMEEQ